MLNCLQKKTTQQMVCGRIDLNAKKSIALPVFVYSLWGLCIAEPFTLGETTVDIPPPEGFVKLTESMAGAAEWMEWAKDENNDLIALYIPAKDKTAALAGEVPVLYRYFMTKINKQMKPFVVGHDDFLQIKALTIKEGEQNYEALLTQLVQSSGNTLEQVKDTFNVDAALKINNNIHLPVHHEQENGLSFSLYIGLDGHQAQSDEPPNYTVSTVSTANVSGKVVYFYSLGARGDLEWTRTASKAWMQNVLAQNVSPPADTQGKGINWDSVLNSGVTGGIMGGLIALGIMVIGRLKKKGQDPK